MISRNQLRHLDFSIRMTQLVLLSPYILFWGTYTMLQFPKGGHEVAVQNNTIKILLPYIALVLPISRLKKRLSYWDLPLLLYEMRVTKCFSVCVAGH